MNNKIEHILLSLLWILVTALGGIFWFNARYGFNIFSSAHWQYLSVLQASQTPVSSGFYFSLILLISVLILGLYIIWRPHRHKQKKVAQQTYPPHPQTNEVPPTTPTPQPEPAPASIPAAPAYPASTTPQMMRPPRLNPSVVKITPTTTPQTTPPNATPAPPVAPVMASDAQTIFSDLGYITKTPPKLHGIQTILLALGLDETLWLGASNISTDQMRDARDVLSDLFIETLDELTIDITSFIISPTGGAPDEDILHFANIDELRAYMNEHPNPPLSESDSENMDAYSEYIDTVLKYLGKL